MGVGIIEEECFFFRVIRFFSLSYGYFFFFSSFFSIKCRSVLIRFFFFGRLKDFVFFGEKYFRIIVFLYFINLLKKIYIEFWCRR